MFHRILNPWRLRVYPWAALATATVAFVFVVFLSEDLVTPQGVPLGGDYPVFYGIGSLVLAGDYLLVFDVSAVNRAQAEALSMPHLDRVLLWAYPPYAALPLAALASIPYLPSYLLFTVMMACCTWGAVCMVGRVSPFIARHRGPAFALALSFYPLLRAVTGGQNTALSLLLICGAMAMFVERRDGAAGAFLGLLMFKPHFALPLIGLALLARRWKVVFVSACVSLGYFLAAVPFFGWKWPQLWFASVVSFRDLESTLNGPKLISLLGVAEQLLGPRDVMAVAVAAVAWVPLVVFLCWLFWFKVSRNQVVVGSWGVATAGIILLSPHTQYYDLGLLVLPLMLLAAREKMQVAAIIFLIWIGGCSQLLFDEPLVQPLFFLAVLGFILALRLVRDNSDPDAIGESLR